MELFKFLQMNWFEITVVLSLVGFAIKATTFISDNMRKFDELKANLEDTIKDENRKMDDKMNKINDRIDDLKNDIKEVRKDTNDKIDCLNDRIDLNEQKRVDGQERTRLIMEGVEATLISLHNDGHNGPVTASLKAINDYRNRKASE